MSLVLTLGLVGEEKLNRHAVRAWAVRQLRCLHAALGIRRAGRLADSIWEQLNDGEVVL
jgi:hypothetical protein